MANDDTGVLRQFAGYIVAAGLWLASRVSGRIGRLEEQGARHDRTLSTHTEEIDELKRFRERVERRGLPDGQNRSLGKGGGDSD